MMRDARPPAGSWIWIVGAMIAVFFGSWWAGGEWRAPAVVALVIGTPLLALTLAVSR